MKKPKSKNERYFQSTGKYKSDKDREFDDGKGRFGKEWREEDKNKSLTGY